MTQTIEEYIRTKHKELPILVASKVPKGDRYRHVFVKIKAFADKFLDGKAGDDRMIVLPGLRGIGKTTLVLQMYRYLLGQTTQPKNPRPISERNIIYLSADNLSHATHAGIRKAVETYVHTMFNCSIVELKEKVFIFIDEAHYDKEWADVAKEIWDESNNIFMLITGSSAISLSIPTDAVRRLTIHPVFPLNFSEYGMLKNWVFPAPGMAEKIRLMLQDPSLLNVKAVQEIEREYRKKFTTTLEKEYEKYLLDGGFAFALTAKTDETHQKIVDIISKVIERDIPQMHPFNSESLLLMQRIIRHLSIKKPGETSVSKLAQEFKSNPALVQEILLVLTQTQLLFSVPPHIKSATSYGKNPWKYYFFSPSILCALRRDIGFPLLSDKGLVYETAVACALQRYVLTSPVALKLHYDKNKDGPEVDFLIENPYTDAVIPVEVGHNKGTEQLLVAIERYRSRFGFLVTDCEKTHIEGKVVRIPFSTLLM